MFTETAMMPAPVRLVFFPDVRPAESKDVKMQVMLSITGRTGLAHSLTMSILLSITIAASNVTRPHFYIEHMACVSTSVYGNPSLHAPNLPMCPQWQDSQRTTRLHL